MKHLVQCHHSNWMHWSQRKSHITENLCHCDLKMFYNLALVLVNKVWISYVMLRTDLDCCPHNLNNYRQSLVNIYRFYVLAELSERWWQWQSCLYLLTRVNNSLFSFTRRKRDIFWPESISTDLTKSFPLRKTNCLAIIRATSIANYLIMNAYYYDISTKYL